MYICLIKNINDIVMSRMFKFKITKIVALAAVCFLQLNFSIAQTASKGKIAVTINNFRNNKGSVRVALFNKPDGFPDAKRGFKIIDKKITNRNCMVEFDDLPKGEYAVSVFHDENDNKILDRNFLGIPKEGVGASNNAKGHFGPPKYKDAKFLFNGNMQTININIVYL